MEHNKAVENKIDINQLRFMREKEFIFCEYKGIKFRFTAIPAFPLTCLNEFVFIYKRNEDGSQGECVGFIEDIGEIDANTLLLLKNIIEQTCLLPKVLEILEVKDEFYSFRIFIKTDRGLTDFFIGAPRKHLVRISEKSILIHDLQNNYYYIENLKGLSKDSLLKLDKII